MSLTVRIKGQDIHLEKPSSYATCWDVWSVREVNGLRALAAALGLCWAYPHRPPISYAKCGFSPLAYGGAVWDHLMAQGVPPQEIIEAGGEAMSLISSGLLSPEEVSAAEASFRPPKDGDAPGGDR